MPPQGFRARTTLSDRTEKPAKTAKSIVKVKDQWSGPSGKKEHEDFPPVPEGQAAGNHITGIAVMLPGRATRLDGGKALVATASGKAFEVVFDTHGVTPAFYFHYAPTWALATCLLQRDPSIAGVLTGGDDKLLSVWNGVSHRLISRTKVIAPIRCIDVREKFVALGMCAGVISFYYLLPSRSLNSAFAFDRSEAAINWNIVFLASRKDALQDISDIKFSPNARMLAVGSHDGYLDLYSFSHEPSSKAAAPTIELKPLKRMRGHNSYVTHIDWSADNTLLQSTCGAYEILYWSATGATDLLFLFTIQIPSNFFEMALTRFQHFYFALCPQLELSC